MPRIPLRLFMLVVALDSSASYAESIPQASAIVMTVEGSAYHATPSLPRPILLQGGETIEAGAVIQTQMRSRLRLLFDTAVLTVGEETRVEFEASTQSTTQRGGFYMSLGHGVVRIVAEGGQDHRVRVQVGQTSEAVHFSQGAVVVWENESVAMAPDGRPVVGRTATNRGVINLGQRDVSWVSDGSITAVPGGSVLTHRHNHRPEIAPRGVTNAAHWIAKTDMGWMAKGETAKETLQSLPRDHHLVSTLQGTAMQENNERVLHTPPAVVSGAVPVVPAITPMRSSSPPGAPGPLSPPIVATSPPAATVPAPPSGTSGPSAFPSLPSFPDIVGSILNGHGKGKR